MEYLHFAPEQPASRKVLLAHGFLRSPETLRHLGAALSVDGVEVICPALKRSTPFAGCHAENARDLVRLRKAMGWDEVVYAGFSAGGLSALLAAAEDSQRCIALILLDPVDHRQLGLEAAPQVHTPTLAITGKPGPGNAQGNAQPMLQALPNARILPIPEAEHFDFEADAPRICYYFTGSRKSVPRQDQVHRHVKESLIDFLIPD